MTSRNLHDHGRTMGGGLAYSVEMSTRTDDLEDPADDADAMEAGFVESDRRIGLRGAGSDDGRARRGVLWSTAFTLGPYLLLVLALLVWTWPHDTLPAGQCEGIGFGCTLTRRDAAVLLTFISAPFAALATGVAWLLVLVLQLSPAKRWTGSAQGAVAAALVLTATGTVLCLQVLV
jgi:hypothetical protein